MSFTLPTSYSTSSSEPLIVENVRENVLKLTNGRDRSLNREKTVYFIVIFFGINVTIFTDELNSFYRGAYFVIEIQECRGKSSFL
jgi:hypothetical protein